MSIQTDKIMNVGDAKVLYDDLRTRINTKMDASLKGIANGVAELNEYGQVPSSQLPSYVDDIIEFPDFQSFTSGETGKIYVALDTNKTYRWSGSEFVEISESLALGETDATAYRGDRGKIAYDHAMSSGEAFTEGFYKITTNGAGHVTAANAVEQSDIVGLGFYTSAEIDSDFVQKSEIDYAGINNISYTTIKDITITTTTDENHTIPYAESLGGSLTFKNKYRVTFDNVEYILNSYNFFYYYETSSTKNEKGYEYLGNLTLYTDNVSGVCYEIDDVPFCFVYDSNILEGIQIYTTTAGQHTIKIEQINLTKTNLPNSLIWDDELVPIIKKYSPTTSYYGVSIGNNSLENVRGTVAIGFGNTVKNEFGVAVGLGNQVAGNQGFAEGGFNIVEGATAHAEGSINIASGRNAHAEGSLNTASGGSSHVEGGNNIASGAFCHAEGNQTTAGPNAIAHAEGLSTTASGLASHTEGSNTIASGSYSHAEGTNTIASGTRSHTEGVSTIASGVISHAEGENTIAVARSSHVGGKFNIADSYDSWPEWVASTNYIVGDKVKVTTIQNSETIITGYICKTSNNDNVFNATNWTKTTYMNYATIIGNGTADDARSNAFALEWDGTGHFTGDVYVNCASDSSSGEKLVSVVDYATQTTAGVIKSSNSGADGIYVEPSNGTIMISKATSAQIKAGTETRKPIVPSSQNEAVFYGLAKVAGDTTQATSNNAVGTYTDAAKTAIQSMLGVPSVSDVSSAYALKNNTVITGSLSMGQYAESTLGTNSVVLGSNVTASGNYAFATGSYSDAKGARAHAEGYQTQANGNQAHAEGRRTYAELNAHAEGYLTEALKEASHAENYLSLANGLYSHAEGQYSVANEESSHAEGSHYKGNIDITSTENANQYIYSSQSGETVEVGNLVWFGHKVATITAINNNIITLNDSFGSISGSAGLYTEYANKYSHIEGYGTHAPSISSHAQGYGTVANGNVSDVSGLYNVKDNLYPTWTTGTSYQIGDIVNYSDFGYECIEANNDASFTAAHWKLITYNAPKAVIVGNGLSTSNRSNAYALDWDGTAHFGGDVYVNCLSDSSSGYMLLHDVQINGTSIVSNGVANIPLASSNAIGAVKVPGEAYGVGIGAQGILYLTKATDDQIRGGTNNYRAIVPSAQHIATFYGLAKAAGDSTASNNAVGIYTNEAKAAIQTMLGVENGVSFVETVSGTTPTITGEPNVRYNCGEVSTISITPPNAGTIDVRFTSGSSAAILTVPNTVKFPAWFDATSLSANTIYEILITDGIYGSVMTWAS